jgi:hypothetical protein
MEKLTKALLRNCKFSISISQHPLVHIMWIKVHNLHIAVEKEVF